MAEYTIEAPTPAANYTVEPPDGTTASGIAASVARGAAPYATGALVGAAAGAPLAGVGAIPGAIAGIGATALTQLGTDVYNWVSGQKAITPQDVTDKILDSVGIKRPSTPIEGAAETTGGIAASMIGVPTAPEIIAGRSAANDLLGDFQQHNITPNVPVIGQGRTAALVAQVGNVLPVSGPVIRSSVGKMLAQTAQASDRAAAGFGAASDAFGQGSAVGNATRRFAEDRSQSVRDYARFFGLMTGAQPAPMTNTLRLVNELMGRFPNMPGLTGLFTRSPIAKLREELTPQTVTVPAKTSSLLNAGGQPIVTQAARTFQRGGVLTIGELKELRSQIGYQLEHPTFGPDDIPRAQAKRLYAALTADMKNAARAQSPEALKALEGATFNYGVRMRLLDKLEPLSKEPPERVFTRLNTAAMTTGSADAGLLIAAKKVMTPEEWGDFGATVISRLGEPTAGAKDILASHHFSPSSFATNWNKLSASAKTLLFGANQPGTQRAGLESLSRIVQAQKNVASLSNVSRSGEYVLTGALGVELVRATLDAATTGNVGGIAGIGLGAGAGYGAARLLMSPKFATWLYALPKIRAPSPQAAMQTGVNLLAVLSNAPDIPQQESAP